MFKPVRQVMAACCLMGAVTGCSAANNVAAESSGSETVISLAGTWGFAGDPENAGLADRWFDRTLDTDTIALPGTTDDKGYGTPHGLKPELTRDVLRILARKHSYVGPAWYQKTVTIPQDWAGKAITLNLERVIWETQVWVNDKPAGMADSLITPHVYDLTERLTPGTHRLTIRIDNSKKYNIGTMPHAHSHETQIKWNGIIGDISLRAADPIQIGRASCRVIFYM